MVDLLHFGTLTKKKHGHLDMLNDLQCVKLNSAEGVAKFSLNQHMDSLSPIIQIYREYIFLKTPISQRQKGRTVTTNFCSCSTNRFKPLCRYKILKLLPNMGKNKMMVGKMVPAASASLGDGEQSTDAMGSTSTPADGAPEQEPIWTWAQFNKPPSSGKDEWIVEYMHLGYLIRRHGKVRKRGFHPIHRSCPVDGARLDTQRLSLIFPLHETSRTVKQDAWTDTKAWSVEDGWRGYTFIKLRETDLASESRSNGNLDEFEVVSQ